MSIQNSFKRTQISASVTFLLVLLVSILTFFANYQFDSAQPQEAPQQIAGGSATGNAIEQLVETPNTLTSHSSPVEPEPSFPQDPFAHIFQGDEIPHELHYRSSHLRPIDFTPPKDSFTSEEFSKWVDQMTSDSNRQNAKDPEAILLGSLKPYSIVVRGNTVLKDIQGLTLTGFHFLAEEGVSLSIQSSQDITLRSTRIDHPSLHPEDSSSNRVGLLIQNSSRVSLLELEIKDHNIGLQLSNNDMSSDLDNEDYLKVQRSLIHHNDTAIQIIDGHGLILTNNFIAHNQQSISIDQRKAALINQSDAIEGFKNVFYQSPIQVDIHYQRDFLSNNILHLDYKKSKFEALAWYWLAH